MRTNNDWWTYLDGQNELMHYGVKGMKWKKGRKYIKMIGNRYFYSPDEIKSFYNQQRGSAAGRDAGNMNSLWMQRNRRIADANRFRQGAYEWGTKTNRDSYYRTQKMLDRGQKASVRNANRDYAIGVAKSKADKYLTPVAKTADKATSKIRKRAGKRISDAYDEAEKRATSAAKKVSKKAGDMYNETKKKASPYANSAQRAGNKAVGNIKKGVAKGTAPIRKAQADRVINKAKKDAAFGFSSNEGKKNMYIKDRDANSVSGRLKKLKNSKRRKKLNNLRKKTEQTVSQIRRKRS